MNYENLVKLFKALLVTALAGALMWVACYVGCLFRSPEPIPVATTSTVSDTASTVVTHTVVVAKPDGTSVTTVDSSAVVNTHAAATTTTPVAVAVKKTRYGIGVRAVYDIKKLNISPKAYDVDTDIRLWQSNVWIGTGSRIEAGRVSEVSLGMRVEL